MIFPGSEKKVLLDYFLFHDKDEGNDGYDYFGYLSLKGDFFIMRISVDGTEGRFSSPQTSYADAWAGRTGPTYGLLTTIRPA